MVAEVKKPVEAAIVTADAPKPQFSPEEYLEMELKGAVRHEFRDGEILEMAGGLPNHNQITLNIAGFLNFSVKGKAYQVFMTDQRLWIPQRRIYTYPDVMVMVLPLMLQDGRKDTVMNPILVVEVLSESTAEYDRGDKFAAYQTIPSFQEYLLVSQSSQRIEHYVKRSEKKWNFQTYDETDTVVQLSSVNLELTIADIYDKVEFETEVAE